MQIFPFKSPQLTGNTVSGLGEYACASLGVHNSVTGPQEQLVPVVALAANAERAARDCRSRGWYFDAGQVGRIFADQSSDAGIDACRAPFGSALAM